MLIAYCCVCNFLLYCGYVLCQIWDLQIFFLVYILSFHSFDSVFCKAKVENFILPFIINFSHGLYFPLVFKKKQWSYIFSPVFFHNLYSFTFYIWIFDPFCITFSLVVRYVLFNFFCTRTSSRSSTLCWTDFSLLCLSTYVENELPVFSVSNFRFSVQFLWWMCLSFCQYHTLLINVVYNKTWDHVMFILQIHSFYSEAFEDSSRSFAILHEFQNNQLITAKIHAVISDRDYSEFKNWSWGNSSQFWLF